MKKKVKSVLILILILVVLSGCSGNNQLTMEKDLEENSIKYKEIIEVTFKNSKANKDIKIIYDFEEEENAVNMFYTLKMVMPDGTKVEQDGKRVLMETTFEEFGEKELEGKTKEEIKKILEQDEYQEV